MCVNQTKMKQRNNYGPDKTARCCGAPGTALRYGLVSFHKPTPIGTISVPGAKEVLRQK
jgi:hypothetical protein